MYIIHINLEKNKYLQVSVHIPRYLLEPLKCDGMATHDSAYERDAINIVGSYSYWLYIATPGRYGENSVDLGRTRSDWTGKGWVSRNRAVIQEGGDGTCCRYRTFHIKTFCRPGVWVSHLRVFQHSRTSRPFISSFSFFFSCRVRRRQASTPENELCRQFSLTAAMLRK